MSRGKEIFQAVCDAPDEAKALASLPVDQWRQLYSFLLLTYDENEASGELLGIMLFDAARRVCTAGGDKS